MILIALGSNLGDREAVLKLSLGRLEQAGITIIKASRTYETPALMPPDAPRDWDRPFLNMVVQVACDLAPEDLLFLLKDTERYLGRLERGHWGPREIDLDLIAYGDAIVSTPDLAVPHPRMAERRFVLEPLVEIAPNWMHPQLRKTAQQLLQELSA